MTAADRLNEIEARAKAATEGPWYRYGTWPYEVYAPREPDGGPYVASVTGDDGHNESNADFIAHARTDVPALVAALRAVLDLHRPEDGFLYDGNVCIQCSGGDHEVPVPCPTVRAIEEALS